MAGNPQKNSFPDQYVSILAGVIGVVLVWKIICAVFDMAVSLLPFFLVGCVVCLLGALYYWGYVKLSAKQEREKPGSNRQQKRARRAAAEEERVARQGTNAGFTPPPLGKRKKKRGRRSKAPNKERNVIFPPGYGHKPKQRQDSINQYKSRS